MAKKLYKLSPSDFRYLWEDCKYCYFRKVVHGIYLPSIGIPAVFNKMTGMLQDEIQGMDLTQINSDLPKGKITAKETYLKSSPLPPNKDCYISGRLDVLSELEDGTFGLIDFKISNQNEEKIKKFSRQLHAYKFALENPREGEAKKISEMGLIVVSPDSIGFKDGHVVFKTKPQWFEINEDMDSFFDFIGEVSGVLSGSTPEPTEGCQWCKYRTHFSLETEEDDGVQQEEIPF